MCNKITEIIINGAVGTAPLSILIKNTIKSVMSGGGFVTHDQFKKAADYWKNKKQNRTEDWRKEGRLIWQERIVKVGMSEVSGSVISGGWMRTDIRQIPGEMLKNGCFIK